MRRSRCRSPWLLAQVLVLPSAVTASPFDPHPLPWRGPWFEGWFTRIVDHASGRSVAVIIGSFEARNGSLSQSWVAALVAGASGPMHSEQALPAPGSVRITRRGQPLAREPSGGPAEFEWASELGQLNVSRGSYSLHFRMPSGLAISASLGSRVPWDPDCPDSCGPEGWLRHLPSSIMPTHYFVETLAAKAQYTVGQDVGHGFGHMETNYGAHFPSAWLWVQAVSADGQTQVVATRGAFSGVPWPYFTLAYRSRRARWDFSSLDLSRMHAEIDGCRCNASLSAASALGDRRLELELDAPCDTFSEPLYFPTRQGFRNKPGCVESYRAVARARIFNGAGDLLESVVIPQAALEFGGGYRCAGAAPAPPSESLIV